MDRHREDPNPRPLAVSKLLHMAVGKDSTTESAAPWPLGAKEMTTYRRADGDTIGYHDFVCDRECCEEWAEDDVYPIEFVEERWVLASERRFTLPICKECDQPATYWGLCEAHAREDDPDAF